MILYHGTTYDSCKSICRDGQLKVTSAENTHYSLEGHYKTTLGYVYLTDNPLAALDFANRRWQTTQGEGYRLLSVLEIELPDEYIEIDYEEKQIHSLTIEAKCYRFPKSINTKTILRIAYFSLSSYNACCKYIDSNNCDVIDWSSKDDKNWNNDVDGKVM